MKWVLSFEGRIIGKWVASDAASSFYKYEVCRRDVEYGNVPFVYFHIFVSRSQVSYGAMTNFDIN